MKNFTIYLSRFIIISLIIPNISCALDQRTSPQSTLSLDETTLIDTTTPDTRASEAKRAEYASTQGILSAADAALSTTTTTPENTSPKEQPTEQATVEFHYINEDLINIVNALAT